jgi:DNA primase
MNDAPTKFDWSAVKPMIDIAAFVEAVLGQPSRTEGSRCWWPCPLHEDRTPSFKTEQGRGWHCFSCGEGGDAADLIQHMQGLTFPHSARRAAEIAGLGYRLDDGSEAQRPHVVLPKPKPRPVEPDRSLTEAEALAIVEEAEAKLWTPAGEKALAYLHDERGLDDETIRKARLGLAEDATARKKDGAEYQFSGVIIPWFDDGRLMRIKVRTLRGTLKYLTPYNAKPEVFPSVDAIQPGLPLIVVEGEFDCLLVAQELAGHASVVTLGSAATKASGRLAFAAMLAGRKYLASDGDDAGDAVAKKLPGCLDRVKPTGGCKDWSDLHATGFNRIKYQWNQVLSIRATWEELKDQTWEVMEYPDDVATPESWLAEFNLRIGRNQPVLVEA